MIFFNRCIFADLKYLGMAMFMVYGKILADVFNQPLSMPAVNLQVVFKMLNTQATMGGLYYNLTSVWRI